MISGLCIVRLSQLLQILIRSRLISFHMLCTTPQIAGIALHATTFPPHNATAAAEALVNLYAQKGHNLQACRRFLRKRPAFSTARSVRRLRRFVCVTPWP